MLGRNTQSWTISNWYQSFEAEIATEKLKRYKPPDSDQMPEEMIQAWSETLLFGIHTHINSIWNREELPDQWKESITIPVYKKGNKTDFSNYHAIFITAINFIQNCIQYPSFQG
jgi:hypothetical protein